MHGTMNIKYFHINPDRFIFSVERGGASSVHRHVYYVRGKHGNYFCMELTQYVPICYFAYIKVIFIIMPFT